MKNIALAGFVLLVMGCASQAPKYEKMEQLKKNQEFEQTVKIVVPDENSNITVTTSTASTTTTLKKKAAKVSKGKKLPEPPSRRQPELESDVGFDGRRPIKDPFRVGEKLIYQMSYFKMSAGTLTLESRPYAEVNGRKNYQFRTSLKTSSLFSSFYSVDDVVDVLMDFEQMVPSVFTLHVKETSQLRESQMYLDHEKNTAIFWEKKVTEKAGEENKKLEWEVLPYTQNVFSAIFYMRTFQWEVGQDNAFRVTNDQENLVFRAKALRREKIKTDVGEFDAIVIKPEIELKGQFKPTGDNFIWLSDDEHHYILKIESKIKIGTLVAELVEIHPGQ